MTLLFTGKAVTPQHPFFSRTATKLLNSKTNDKIQQFCSGLEGYAKEVEYFPSLIFPFRQCLCRPFHHKPLSKRMAPTATKGEDVSCIPPPKVRAKRLVTLAKEEKVRIKTDALIFALICGSQMFLFLRH